MTMAGHSIAVFEAAVAPEGWVETRAPREDGAAGKGDGGDGGDEVGGSRFP
jgi:hypothetical protein